MGGNAETTWGWQKRIQKNTTYVIVFGVFLILLGVFLKVARIGEGTALGLGGYQIVGGVTMIVFAYFLKRHYKGS